jgi:biotin operon repressor
MDDRALSTLATSTARTDSARVSPTVTRVHVAVEHDGYWRIPPVTPRQIEVLAAIAAQTRRRGYPPSCAELSKLFGIGRTAVRNHCEALISKGLLVESCGKSRTTLLTPAGRALLASRRWRFQRVKNGRVGQ